MLQTQAIPQKRHFNVGGIFRITAVILVIVAFADYLLIGAIAANMLTVPQRIYTNDNPQKHGMSYEEVRLSARVDGIEIAAWYIPAIVDEAAENSPAIVMVHGWNASRTNAYNQHFLDLAEALHQAGFSLLMIDLRGHGESEASHFTFGLLERRDVLAAVDYLIQRGHQPGRIGLLGTSMGAAAVIGAAVEDEDVGAVATDSLFAEINPVVHGLWVKQSGLPIIFLYPTLWMHYLENGWALGSVRPVDEVGKIAPRPLLLIHCEQDTYIPAEQFQQMEQAAPWAQTWAVQECSHAEIYGYVPEEYNQKLITFFEVGLK
jgi:pimeloyl-ACP methyl ester carboxylesterase